MDIILVKNHCKNKQLFPFPQEKKPKKQQSKTCDTPSAWSPMPRLCLGPALKKLPTENCQLKTFHYLCP